MGASFADADSLEPRPTWRRPTRTPSHRPHSSSKAWGFFAQSIGSSAAFVAQPQFWGSCWGAVVGAVLGSFGQFWSAWSPQKLPRNTGLHVLSVTKAAVDPSNRCKKHVLMELLDRNLPCTDDLASPGRRCKPPRNCTVISTKLKLNSWPTLPSMRAAEARIFD
jgi:hypothetical protein